MARGQSETVVVEPGDHELLINKLPELTTLINLGFVSRWILCWLSSTGPIDALRVNHIKMAVRSRKGSSFRVLRVMTSSISAYSLRIYELNLQFS